MLIIALTVALVGWIAIILHEPLCRLFMNHTGTPEQTEKIIAYANERLILIAGTYFLDGMMEIATYSLRGIGYSITSMMIVLVGTCLFRIVWIYFIFPMYPKLFFLFMLYPISWTITLIVAWVWFSVKLKQDEKASAIKSDFT